MFLTFAGCYTYKPSMRIIKVIHILVFDKLQKLNEFRVQSPRNAVYRRRPCYVSKTPPITPRIAVYKTPSNSSHCLFTWISSTNLSLWYVSFRYENVFVYTFDTPLRCLFMSESLVSNYIITSSLWVSIFLVYFDKPLHGLFMSESLVCINISQQHRLAASL